MSPVVIFDFDGTIVDSLDAVISAYNQVAPLLRARAVDPRSLPRLRKMRPRAAMREHAVSLWKLPLLVQLVRIRLRSSIDALQPHVGMMPALRTLAESGLRCGILSTNSRTNIQRFLIRQELAFFDPVAGGASMFGKARALKQLLARARLDAASTYYVGDEVRDVHAAARARVRSIAVTWGYADRGALAAAAPTHLVDRPEELVALLTDLRARAG